MKNNIKKTIYEKAMKFKTKYPMTVAFRIKAHAKVAANFVDEDEKILYVFVCQKNFRSYEIANTNIIILTDKRMVLATKRIVFGYFFKAVTQDMFNDLTIKNGLLWGKVIIDTVNEKVVLSNIDPNALGEIETNIMKVMIRENKERINKK